MSAGRSWRGIIGDFLIVIGTRIQGRLAVGYAPTGERSQEPSFYHWGHSSADRPFVMLQVTNLSIGTSRLIFSPKQAMMLCEAGLDAVSESLERSGLVEAPDWDVRGVKVRVE